ncbi:MAG: hypothetical protein HRT77_11315 [Halioglobus sp.]|nr:hypothetical protein [Halioglobus sp.]
MKKRIFALSIALAAGIATAQPASTVKPAAGAPTSGTAAASDTLGVTDEQKVQMRKIRREGGSRQDVLSVLTPEQRAKRAKLQPYRKGSAEDKFVRLKRHLDLSDEQHVAIQQIHEAGGSRHDVRGVLTPEQQHKIRKLRKDGKAAQRSSDAVALPLATTEAD